MKPTASPVYGAVPAEWQSIRMKYVTNFGPSKEAVRELLDNKELVTFLPMERVSGKGEVETEEQEVITKLWNGFTYCEDGDVIVAKITPCFENGKGALLGGLLNGVAFASTEFYVLRPFRRLEGKYLYYLTYMYPFRDYGESQMQGAAGQQRVPQRALKDLFIGLPKREEQQAIARFLDHKTALIDQYITNKKKQIELLEKLCTAIISEAVTMGLNPDVEMKDSGVEWLGVTPSHWGTKKLRFLAKFKGGGTPSKDNSKFWNGDIPWVSPKDMGEHIIQDSDDHITDEAIIGSSTNLIHAGSVIMVVRSGILRRAIPVAILGVDAALNQDMKAMITKEEYLQEYLMYIIHGNQELFLAEWVKEGATVESVEFKLLVDTSFPVPPAPEQQEIISKITEKSRQIDLLIVNVKEQMVKMQTYRTSLISEAVTGKIDVRNFNPEPLDTITIEAG